MKPPLPPLHSDQYYTNTSSMPFMRNVLVLTMPNTRNYTINTDLRDNHTVGTHFQIYSTTFCFFPLFKGRGSLYLSANKWKCTVRKLLSNEARCRERNKSKISLPTGSVTDVLYLTMSSSLELNVVSCICGT